MEFIDDYTIRGSSYGWLTLFNRDTLDLFLYNQITLRRINLPTIHNLPPYANCNKYVSKVILSCSPDEDEQNCRAMMIFNGKQPLAFCCPGRRSMEWTPIGMYTLIGKDKRTMEYQDVVYSSRRNLFFALEGTGKLETWDLSDLSSPRMIKSIATFDNGDDDSSDSDESDLTLPKELSDTHDYLVVADELFSDDEDDLLFVRRYAMDGVAPDGAYYKDLATYDDNIPQVTIGFDIDVYDLEEGKLYGFDGGLEDQAIFVGEVSESVALSATRFPELKPNSIYFTDVYGSIIGGPKYGGHDIGICNYENQTVSPCYYPCDVQSLKRIEPSPVWFYPRGPV